ncbi:MAG: hypothetical protein ACRD0B_07605 [Acidimicrobiales bacterium]
MPGAGYDMALVAHVAAAVVGFGAIGAGGLEASRGRRSSDPARDLSLRRFFRPGKDWASAVIFLVPLIGLGLLFGGDRGDATRPWPWIGLGLWTSAASVAMAALWPAERRAQRLLAELVAHLETAPVGQTALVGGGRDVLGVATPAGAEAFRAACAVMERAAGVISVLFLVAVAVMIVQP